MNVSKTMQSITLRTLIAWKRPKTKVTKIVRRILSPTLLSSQTGLSSWVSFSKIDQMAYPGRKKTNKRPKLQFHNCIVWPVMTKSKIEAREKRLIAKLNAIFWFSDILISWVFSRYIPLGESLSMAGRSIPLF